MYHIGRLTRIEDPNLSYHQCLYLIRSNLKFYVSHVSHFYLYMMLNNYEI